MSGRKKNTKGRAAAAATPSIDETSSSSPNDGEYRREIRNAFDLCDVEHTGVIHINQLKVVMRALGFEPRQDEVDRLAKQIGDNAANTITIDDLYRILLPKMAEKSTMREMRKAFELFDEDNSGYISMDNLRRISTELGEKMTDEELREMIAEADTSQLGIVTEENFYTIMKKTGLY